MSSLTSKYVAVATMIGLVWMQPTTAVHAAITDYEFQLIQKEVKQGQKVEVAVRLVDKRNGSSVPDAVIFAQRIDMAPDGMAMMAAPIRVLPSTEPGTYRFEADLSMEGRWQLSLAAKVQGEADTLESKLVVEVSP